MVRDELGPSCVAEVCQGGNKNETAGGCRDFGSITVLHEISRQRQREITSGRVTFDDDVRGVEANGVDEVIIPCDGINECSKEGVGSR
jgi:hypothetical protein